MAELILNPDYIIDNSPLLNKLELISDIIRTEEEKIENLINTALENNLFKIYYQPIIDLKENKIVSAEALIRIITSDRKVILPNYFIPFAEKSGNYEHIFKITRWLIENLQKELNYIYFYSHQAIKISFNIPPNPKILKSSIFEKLHDLTGSNNFEIELTERIFIGDDIYNIKGNLKRIKKLGYDIIIDDFGTGYSCLSYLNYLPIDGLKIDRSFTQHIPHNDKTCLIVESLINLCKKLGIKTIAEGIENKKQADWFLEKDCDIIQGYLFSKPLPIKSFVNFVRNF